MIRVIEQVRPKLFLFENVKGLLSGRWTPSGAKKGEIWEDVKASFRAIEGYSVRQYNRPCQEISESPRIAPACS